jgi:membrane associated rhomboid family serine protease
LENKLDKDLKEFFKKSYKALLLCSIIIIVELFESITSKELGYYGGIYPRHIDGVIGIISAPLLHSDWGHVFSNIVPLFFLLTMLEYFYKRVSIPTVVGIWLLTGLLVWIFAKDNAFHIGASGVVYGIIAFIFSSGIFKANTRSIILSFIILIAYGGYFEGLAPKIGISWESHLYGALSGIFFAFIFKNIVEEGEVEDHEIEGYKTTKKLFFDTNTFEMTKVERLRVLEEERLELERQRLATYLEQLRISQLGIDEKLNE